VDIQQEFVLDRFHSNRAARRAFQDRAKAKHMETRLRRESFSAVRAELREQIEQPEGNQKDKRKYFYKYVRNNQYGLLDLDQCGFILPTWHGDVEGNVDKLLVHRMKGCGCS
jgi:hypothetical protein